MYMKFKQRIYTKYTFVEIKFKNTVYELVMYYKLQVSALDDESFDTSKDELKKLKIKI